jgi:hypothetical protein
LEEASLLHVSAEAIKEKRSEGLVTRMERALETAEGNSRFYYELGYARVETGDLRGAVEAP